MININILSRKYKVRRLNENDISIILELCKKNTEYYDYCPPMVDEDSIKEDILALPENITYDDKYYVGLFDDEVLIAILDLITNYPNKETAFIGFFMVNKENHNKGIGFLMIKEICDYLKNVGYKNIRLAWVKGNKQAENFWKKNGFIEIEERKDQNNHSVVLASKNL